MLYLYNYLFNLSYQTESFEEQALKRQEDFRELLIPETAATRSMYINPLQQAPKITFQTCK